MSIVWFTKLFWTDSKFMTHEESWVSWKALREYWQVQMCMCCVPHKLAWLPNISLIFLTYIFCGYMITWFMVPVHACVAGHLMFCLVIALTVQILLQSKSAKIEANPESSVTWEISLSDNSVTCSQFSEQEPSNSYKEHIIPPKFWYSIFIIHWRWICEELLETLQ